MKTTVLIKIKTNEGQSAEQVFVSKDIEDNTKFLHEAMDAVIKELKNA